MEFYIQPTDLWVSVRYFTSIETLECSSPHTSFRSCTLRHRHHRDMSSKRDCLYLNAQPRFLILIVLHLDIYSAFANVRTKFSYLCAQSLFIDHVPPWLGYTTRLHWIVTSISPNYFRVETEKPFERSDRISYVGRDGTLLTLSKASRFSSCTTISHSGNRVRRQDAMLLPLSEESVRIMIKSNLYLLFVFP